MVSKYLEKKIELCDNESMTGVKNPVQLEYYLLESEISSMDELDGKKVYGIEIVKTVNEINVESGMVRNIFCCRESTKQMLDRLANNTVTPVCLPFILDDLIGV